MLYDMVTIIFHKIYPKCCDVPRKSMEELKNERPDVSTLDEYYKFAVEYFDLMANAFAEVSAVFRGNSPGKAIVQYRNADGGSVLYRPLGQSESLLRRSGISSSSIRRAIP